MGYRKAYRMTHPTQWAISQVAKQFKKNGDTAIMPS